MARRSLLICCVGFGAVSLVVGTFAIGQKGAGRGKLGTCAGYSGLSSEDNEHAGMVFILGGTFVMGSEHQRPEERLTHIVCLNGFEIDRHEVTNAQFREFVVATRYVMLAERGAARQSQEVDLGAAHLGFRTVLKQSEGEPALIDSSCPLLAPSGG